MVTKVNSLVLGNGEVHNYHLNGDVFGGGSGQAVEGNQTIIVSTAGSLSGGGTITMGNGGDITITYNEPTNVSHFVNDSNYTSIGDGLSVFNNNVGYVITGSNLSVFNNDVGYVTGSANVSIFNNDANYVTSGSNISIFSNDSGYLTSETDPTVASYIKAITATDISDWNSSYGWGDHGTQGYLVASGTDDIPEGINNLYHTIERVEDDVANILLAGNNITIVHDDNANNITISAAYPNLQFNDTDDLTEGVTNLYFTNERVDDRVSALLTAGTNISLSYDDIANTLTINASGVDLSGSTTDELSEGNTNLYYTDARARTSISGGTGVTYSNSTGIVSIGQNVATTANVQFGNIQTNSISTLDYADFDIISSNPSFTEGRMFYDNVNKTVALYVEEPDITLQIGQEEWIRVYNNSGVTIDNGKPVYISGSNSGFATVALANASSINTYDAIGLATHSIEDATYGYVTTKGVVRSVDTSGIPVGSVHVGTTDGSLSSSPASYPNFPHEVGYCIVSDAINGSIYVTISQHTVEEIRVFGDARIDNNLTIGGNFTVLGSQNIVSVNNLKLSDNFIYLNGGDTIGLDNTSFTGTGLNDGILVDHYTGTTSKTYYVRIDSTGTPDTFEWSLDNFSTTEATGIPIGSSPNFLSDNIYIDFNSTTGHNVGDIWSGTAVPLNVDMGFVGNRNTGTTGIGYTHTGLFFDVTDEKFKFFDQYFPEVEGDVDSGHATFNLGDIVANSFEGIVDWSYLQNIPNPTITVALSGDVSGSGNTTLTNLGNGSISIAAVVANDSHTHDGRYFTETESDARFAPISHTHAYDNYGGWNLSVAGVDRGQISTNERVSFVAGTNVSLGYGATNNAITINSTYVDTDITDWRVASGSGAEFFTVNKGDQVRFIGSGATSVAFDPIVNSVTFTSTDTNTQRPIHDSPINGATTTSISSNWAFGHNALTSAHGSTNLNTASRIVQRDASGNFSAGTVTASLSGNASTASKWQTARTITLGGDLSGSVSIDGSADVTLTTTISANSVALGTDTTGNYVASVGVSGNGLGVTGTAGEGSTFTLTSNATSVNTPNTIVYRDASGNFSAGVITATATQSRYADLAEKYTTSIEHPVGTVMMVSFSDDYETEPCGINGMPVGIISHKPAILMNESIDGQALALKGRVPVRVIGAVAKGQSVYVYYNGTASIAHNGKPLVGVALETNNIDEEKLVECVVMI